MPVYEVEASIVTTLAGTVIVQADDAESARSVAREIVQDWDIRDGSGEMDLGAVTELSADEALAHASEVVA